MAIPQEALDPHPDPLQVQDDEPPHEPAENPLGEPAEQVLLDHPHAPFTAQGALALLQLISVVPPN